MLPPVENIGEAECWLSHSNQNLISGFRRAVSVSATTNTTYNTMAMQASFPVAAAGSYTFRLGCGFYMALSPAPRINNAQLTAVYLPARTP